MAYVPNNGVAGAMTLDQFKKSGQQMAWGKPQNTVAQPTTPTPQAPTLTSTPQYQGLAKPTLATVNTPTYQAYDAKNDIQSLATARNKQLSSQLEAKKQTALSALQAEADNTSRVATDNRNTSSTQSQLGAKNFAEFMAARGGSRDGANAQAALSNNIKLQGTLSQIGSDEQNALADIARRKTLAEMQYAADLASGQAGVDADVMDRTINANQQNSQLKNAYDQWLYNAQTQANRDSMNDYRADETMNYNKYRDSVGDTRYANEQAYNQYLDKLKNQQWQDTFDYNKQRDVVGDTQWNKTFDYNQQRDTTKDKQWQDTFDYGKQRDTVADGQWNKTFDYNKSRDTVKDNQWQTTFDYGKSQDAIKNSQWDKSFNADNAYRNATLAQRSSGGGSSSVESALNGGKPLSTTQKNQYYSEAYKAIKGLSVNDAVNVLENSKREELESVLGHSGYVKLYNDVLANAIKAGQAKAYNSQE